MVDDPTARYMGGVAGHAGVFSTADDLGKFCQMILDGGDGLFSPATIQKFTESPDAGRRANPILRGLGWDIQSPVFRSARRIVSGRAPSGIPDSPAPRSGSIPASQTYVVLLTNSVHPQQRKAITPLRAAGRHDRRGQSVGYERPGNREVSTGLDVLEQINFQPLQG